MKALFPSMMCLVLCVPGFAHSADSETPVRQTVEAFYTAYDHGFEGKVEFATEDWNHTNPGGGRARGRDAVLKDVRGVHATFLKGVTDTVENMDVRFATPDVAVVTVTSRTSAYTSPDGIRHPENEGVIRTFVVVKQSVRWLIMQDQNTIIGQDFGVR